MGKLASRSGLRTLIAETRTWLTDFEASPQQRVSSVRVWALLILFALVFAFPSGSFHAFSGVPFSSLKEYFWLLLFVPFIFSKPLRCKLAVLLRSSQGKVWFILLAAGLLGLGLKSVILVSGENEGFLACYRPLVNPLPGGECERSYENPFYLFDVTRLDYRLDFNKESWRLTFFNSSRFNFYPWVEDNISRNRLPFTVQWLGDIENTAARTLQISYLGEGQVRVGNTTIALLPAYTERNTVSIPIDSGRHEVDITYRFDDGYRIGDEAIPGPYAQFKVELVTQGDGVGPTPLQAIPPSLVWQIAGGMVDLSLILMAIGFSLVYAWALYPYKFVLIILLPFAGMIYWYGWPTIAGFSPPQQYIIFIAAFYLLVALSRRQNRALMAYFVLFSVALLRVNYDFGDIGHVVYHSAGNDWLTNESLPRFILETGSLEAGEAVFYYQPFYRYVKFTEHFLLGDSDTLTGAFILGLLNFSIFFFQCQLTKSNHDPAWKRILLLIPGLWLVVLMNLSALLSFIYRDASEVLTWILLPLALALLFTSKSEVDRGMGIVLLALSGITRPNHLPAVAFILAVLFFGRVRVKQWKTLWLYPCLFGLVILLPLAHNLYYGGQAVLLTTSASHPKNLILQPSDLLNIPKDVELQNTIMGQLEYVLFMNNPSVLSDLQRQLGHVLYQHNELPVEFLSYGFRGLQLMWVLAAMSSFLVFPQKSLSKRLLFLLPVLYLTAHIFYQVTVYYPRHIVAGHLAMGLVAALGLSSMTGFGALGGIDSLRNEEAREQANGRSL